MAVPVQAAVRYIKRLKLNPTRQWPIVRAYVTFAPHHKDEYSVTQAQ